ncbi:hypothetical protein BU604_10145, partial [Staphylococcus arlettae]|uniref:hypothetical protein n=1 Tax=Staphylococcus arlettae TaxID=29378 RepID=UPI000FF5C416
QRPQFKKLTYKILLEVKLNTKDKIEPIFKGNFSHRSTIKDQENKIVDIVDAKIISVEKDTFILEIEFDAKHYPKNEIYDLSLSITSKDKFFDIEVGDKSKKINLSRLSHRKCKPFYTDEDSNISFEL